MTTTMNDRAIKAADQIMAAMATDAGNNRDTIATIVFLALIAAVVADRNRAIDPLMELSTWTERVAMGSTRRNH